MTKAAAILYVHPDMQAWSNTDRCRVRGVSPSKRVVSVNACGCWRRTCALARATTVEAPVLHAPTEVHCAPAPRAAHASSPYATGVPRSHVQQRVHRPRPASTTLRSLPSCDRHRAIITASPRSHDEDAGSKSELPGRVGDAPGRAAAPVRLFPPPGAGDLRSPGPAGEPGLPGREGGGLFEALG